MRSLEERAALTRRLSERARQRKHSWLARAFEERAIVAEEHAAVVREVLLNRTATHGVPDHSEAAASPADPTVAHGAAVKD